MEAFHVLPFHRVGSAVVEQVKHWNVVTLVKLIKSNIRPFWPLSSTYHSLQRAARPKYVYSGSVDVVLSLSPRSLSDLRCCVVYSANLS